MTVPRGMPSASRVLGAGSSIGDALDALLGRQLDAGADETETADRRRATAGDHIQGLAGGPGPGHQVPAGRGGRRLTLAMNETGAGVQTGQQVPPDVGGVGLASEQRVTAQTTAAGGECRGQGVIRARDTEGDDAARTAGPRFRQQELKLPDLVAAVELARAVVSFDPELGAAGRGIEQALVHPSVGIEQLQLIHQAPVLAFEFGLKNPHAA